MNVYRAIILALTATFASCNALADGNTLLTQCQHFVKAADGEKDFDRSQAGMCIGFIEGVLSTTDFFRENLTSEARLCPPRNATNGQLSRVIVKYLKDNPAKLNQGKTGLVWLAIKDAYPCKG